MGLQEIDAKMLSRMFLAGARNLESKKEWINELNVFPVPDGDTGTNMTMTIMSAAREVVALGENPSMEAVCKAISGGSLRGARGNSGVILSQIFRGFTKRLKSEQNLTVPVMAEAFEKAVETAYKAVMKPKEGTILTVARGIAEKGRELVDDGVTDMETYLNTVIEHAKYVLSQTPEMLPVLKQAGVVDSGGQGLVEVITGFYEGYLGREVSLDIPAQNGPENAGVSAKIQETEIRFGYCTEFIIMLNKPFHAKNEKDLKAYLESIGDSIVCVADDSVVKVHVHTNDPGLAIQKALKYGPLSNIKIDNMRLEHQEKLFQMAGKENAVPEEVKRQEPPKDYGFIAVSSGEGMKEIFTSLGADCIIEGGQTMNPSTADILDAVDKVNAKTVFILPNNKNIILAANQAAELTTDKDLLVIPTKTIPQGITAIINFVPELSADENEETMIREIASVHTGEVTYAVRDTVIEDRTICKDDFMGLGDGGLLSVGKNLEQVAAETIENMMLEDAELISIYYGADVKKEDAETFAGQISQTYGGCDVELQYGGQPIYYYVMSVE